MKSPLTAYWSKRFFFQTVCLTLVGILLGKSSSAQTTAPYTVNIVGNLFSNGLYNFEWSVGESAAITTMNNSNLLVTNVLPNR